MGSDEAARRRYEAVFAAHARAVLAYALRRVATPADAADVTAETMLVAWRRLDDVPAGEEARLWLYGVARGVLSNHRRGRRRRVRLGERLRTVLAAETAPAADHRHGVHDDVHAALARLGPDDRELLHLTAWEGLAPGDVAVVLGISPEAARSRLHRARGRLRSQLERQAGADPLVAEWRT